MQIKVLVFIACVVAVNAGLLPEALSEHYDAHPSYNFKYSVDDSTTGDVKAQTESRDGDNVQGQYTLNDADGYKRIVDYTSDAVSGFKAVVRRERLGSVATNTAAAQKLVSVHQADVPKSAPTTVVHHHQPTVYHHAPQTVHFLHTSPSAAIVKASPALIATTHHHSPTIVHHNPTLVHHAPAAVVHHAPALVKASIGTPHHVSYVHYH